MTNQRDVPATEAIIDKASNNSFANRLRNGKQDRMMIDRTL